MNALIGNRDTDALEQSSTQYETVTFGVKNR